MNNIERNKNIVLAIRTLWSSLDTHLDDTYEPTYDKLKSKIAKKEVGNRQFHTKTIQEYAEAIKALTDIL